MKISLRKTCSVCGSNNLEKVLDLGDQPLCDDLIKIGSKEKSNLYPLQIFLCTECYTAHQQIEVSKEVLFPQTYHYRAANTPSVLSGMQELVNELSTILSTKKNNLTVVDIGCNDGSLLNLFKKYKFKTIGVDPTDAIKKASTNHSTYQSYFDINTAENIINDHGKPDIITFTNSFAHIENLEQLLKGVESLMSEETILVIENHYLGTVLNTGQFDTFYHEHVRTYSAKSFEYIAKSLSAYIWKYSFPERYGGNIRVFISKKKPVKICSELDESCTSMKFEKLSVFISDWKKRKLMEIENYVKLTKSPMTGIAFPGRASIPINILKLDKELISATYEIKGSFKTGFYIPGTKIPILPEAELFHKDEKPPTVLNLAWHIEGDVIQNLKSNSYTPKLLNII